MATKSKRGKKISKAKKLEHTKPLVVLNHFANKK